MRWQSYLDRELPKIETIIYLLPASTAEILRSKHCSGRFKIQLRSGNAARMANVGFRSMVQSPQSRDLTVCVGVISWRPWERAIRAAYIR